MASGPAGRQCRWGPGPLRARRGYHVPHYLQTRFSILLVIGKVIQVAFVIVLKEVVVPVVLKVYAFPIDISVEKIKVILLSIRPYGHARLASPHVLLRPDRRACQSAHHRFSTDSIVELRPAAKMSATGAAASFFPGNDLRIAMNGS